MAANAGRYPVSAQCKALGVARSTCGRTRSRAAAPKAPDPIVPDALAAHEASRGRICRIMRESGPTGAYGRKKLKCRPGKPNEADLPNVAARQLGGRAPRTHVRSDLAYVRVGGGWNCVCLPISLRNREIVGHSAGPRKGADPVGAALAALEFPTSDIEAFHANREAGSTSRRQAGCSTPSASSGRRRGRGARTAARSTSKMLKAEFACREAFGSTRELRVKLADCVHWCNNFRVHSTLGYTTPVEFGKAGLVLPKSSKKV